MKKMKFWSILLLMSVSLPLLNSCGSDDDDDGAKPLSVSPASVSMKYDESQQLSASGATSWRSENEFVASVDQNGLVKGRHIGSTDIVVYCGVDPADQRRGLVCGRRGWNCAAIPSAGNSDRCNGRFHRRAIPAIW